MATESGSSGDELAALLDAEFAETQSEPESGDADVNGGKAGQQEKEQEGIAKRRKLDDRGSTCPPHPGYMGGICIRCGANKEEGGTTGMALKYIHHGLEVSHDEAQRLRDFSASHALASRRLLLVLDLDHTLLNSTRLMDVSPEAEEMLHAQVTAHPGNERHLLFHLPFMRMWTKLRPGIHDFLAEANKNFELHVYTMGDNDYAAGMATLLDPDGKLFAGRVASARDAGPGGFKDVDVLLGAEDMVLILDDTSGVWPRHRGNLIEVERYVYFPGCAQKFGYGPSLLERREDEDADCGMLSTCLRVLNEVHSRFFEEYDKVQQEGKGPAPDIRRHLSAVRQEILAGSKILFSRIIPLDCADPKSHPTWKLATRLGAECTTVPSEDVTHVVAGDITDKTRWGEQVGAHVVNGHWLRACEITWRKADESCFPVVPNGSSMPVQKNKTSDLKTALAAAGGGQS